MKSLKLQRVFRMSLGVVLAICASSLIAQDAFSRGRTCDLAPTGVERSDYWLDFVTEGMPDPNLNGLPAQIRVHRVQPVYANGKCPNVPNLAAVLVHGRSVAGAPSFDFLFPNLESPQELLAKAGIDTFAPDLLGYGYSSRLSLDDACNASYPGYNANGTCSFAHCDRSPNPTVAVVDQQRKPDPSLGAGDGVRVNPLNHLPGEICEHSSDHHFANNDVWARDILQVIDDAIEKAQPRGHKVVLIGYSLGGTRVARALYLLGNEAERQVNRVVFWSSLFNRAFAGGNSVDDTVPTEEGQIPATGFPTFPLSVGAFPGILGSLRESFCSGRLLPGSSDAFKQAMRDQEDPTKDPRYPDGDWQDLFGLDWGGSVLGSPTGLNRLPTFTRYGWNPEVAATFTLPTLVMQGIDDTIIPVQNSSNIFDSLTSVTNKVLVQVGCGGHQMQEETCGDGDSDHDGIVCEAGDRCCTPQSGSVYGGTSNRWEGPHSTVAAALIEWIKDGTFDGSECGSFMVDPSGVAHPVATSNCPAVP